MVVKLYYGKSAHTVQKCTTTDLPTAQWLENSPCKRGVKASVQTPVPTFNKQMNKRLSIVTYSHRDKD